MSRLIWILMLAGLFAAPGCEQKPADRTPGKVTSEDVRRDAGRAAKTAAEYSEQTKEEFQKKLEGQLADPTPGQAASEDVRRDAGQAASEHSKRIKEEFQRKKFRPQPADRTPGKAASEDMRRDAGQAVDTASAYSLRMRKEFQKKLEAQLDELDGRIAELRAKGSSLKNPAKANLNQMMAELDAKRDAARAKLDKVVHSSGDVWDAAKKEAESGWNDLDNAFRDAWKRF